MPAGVALEAGVRMYSTHAGTAVCLLRCAHGEVCGMDAEKPVKEVKLKAFPNQESMDGIPWGVEVQVFTRTTVTHTLVLSWQLEQDPVCPRG